MISANGLQGGGAGTSDLKQEVTILCYTVPDCEVPSNFLLESLGDPADVGNDIGEWSPGRRGRDFRSEAGGDDPLLYRAGLRGAFELLTGVPRRSGRRRQ